MIDALADICRNNLYKDKLLLVPTYAIGQNIIDMLSEKTPVLNLKVGTIQGIAAEIGMPLLSAGSMTLADDNISRHIMFCVIYNMRRNNEFEYFTDILSTPSISNSIWNAVMEIKYACINCDSLDEYSFVNPGKGRDIKKIIAAYDLELKKQGMADYPELISIILQNSRKEDVLFLVPNNIKLRLLEKKLIADKFSSIQILYSEPVKGINVPTSYYCADYPEKPGFDSPFANLYAFDRNSNSSDLKNVDNIHRTSPDAEYSSEAPVSGSAERSCDSSEEIEFSNINLMKAYGENNEIEAVLRDIKAKRIPFDNACIYASSNEPYAQLLYQKAGQLGIPVTFGYGVNIQNSRPGKAFSAVMRWIASNYQVTELINMLYQELIHIPGENDEAVNPYRAANILRASGIGWRRERYFSVLAGLSSVETENGSDDEYKIKKAKILTAVTQFIKNVFDIIPEAAGGNISLKELAKGISEFIRAFAQVKSELDAEAKAALTESLNQIASGAGLFTDIDEALRILRSNIQNIRIGVSGPKNGHLHLCGFDSGLYIKRCYHYFVGLDADRFPGSAAEDAILLDIEKRRLSENIILNKEKLNENIYKLVELMSGLKGYITLIYSSFDTAENRSKIPSSFVLQVYRMINRNLSAGYTDLENHFKKTEGYITQNAVDESGFWLYKYFNSTGAIDIKGSVFECYPHLRQGREAWDSQSSEKFTHYDGYIGRFGIKTDGEVFSASKLELLAKCSYRYYLRYVLNISPPDELIYDPETWLNPLEKGTLYHAVFERFYKAISEIKEKPNREKHNELIIRIAESAIDEFKTKIPPPNEIVFDIEKREIIESCLIFLAGEEENADDGIPIEFELGFGIDDKGYPPVEIILPSKRKFLLSGIIDRIDKMGENIYRIIDYKSGGTYGYSDREYFKGGKQIQHALYAYACEMLLGKNNGMQNAKVTEGIYLFPTKKGEGRRFVRVQRDISELLELLDDLFTIIEEGIFAAAEDPGECRWCDYQVVCRIERLHKVIAGKRSDPDVKALSAIRRLAEYE
ncbi:MAG TPA: PD-(D/E)XK nuclease family protein [Ruminiclostridium sp.]|nr:PD-(D/E)XK nuclease family protein [Clostridiaceae bacterium]HAA25568.1 PD-(D/E)XK nuclease family protein [Ruminiclostridium sp.]